MSRRRRAAKIASEVLLWVLAARLIVVFVPAGWDKLDSSGEWAGAFEVWGYPVWFRILVGAVELGAAVLLAWPRTAAFGAAGIIVVMLGGMGTHAFIEHRPAGAVSELAHLVLASVVLVGRWRTRIRPRLGRWPR